MAKLFENFSFNTVGYEFESAIRSFRKSFELSRSALEADVEKIRADLEAYLAGDEFVGERTDEGDIIWEQDRIYEMDIEAAEDAVLELRRTYMIAIYHAWERAIRRQTKTDVHSHALLVEAAKKDHIEPLPELEKVSQLVNLLKHNNAKWAKKLLDSWPDVVTPGILGRRDGDYYSSVILTDDHIEEILRAAAASGPVGFPDRQP
ncbi:MAG: hypothetical protein KL863_05160 [Rhizobium sp.]|nr:hypothetical protein [Rhizobium sp.]